MTRSNHHRLSRLLSACMLIALLLTPLAGIASAEQRTPVSAEAVKLPDAANAAAIELPAADKSATPGLESRLAQMVAAAAAGDQKTLATFAGERFFDLATGRVRVILEMARSPEARPAGGPTYEVVVLPNGKQATIEHAPQIVVQAELMDAIAAAGAAYETAYENWVQVSAPLADVAALAKIAGVAYVRFPLPAQELDVPAEPQVGLYTSEGVNLTQANVWHAANYNGSGVNLAVFDFGFTGWNTRQTNGDLPAGANLVLKDFSASYDFGPPGTAGAEHGTACAEIAYDMAPGVDKVYLYAFSTDAEFGNAVNDYRNNVSGKRVASMSIGWVNAGPYDGTGPINTIVDNAQASGIFWASAAGNQQRQHHSWTSAQYQTGNSVAFGTGNINAFGPDQGTGSVWNIPSGTKITVFLEWNDWNAARTGNQNRIDYDLYLVKWNGSTWATVASSVGNQCNSANVTPVEQISFTTTATTNTYYGVYIQRYQVSGTCSNNFGHWMQLHTFNGFYTAGTGSDYAFWYRNVCNSITIPADGDSAMAVGATFWGEDGNATYDYGLETFSSFGPRNASGGGAPGSTVNKPNVVAPDGVSTGAYGASNNQPWRTATSTGFWGTSAAAPHVAGAAASVWTLYPTYTLAQVRGYLQDKALYRADGGTCGGSLAAPNDSGSAPSPQSGTQNNRFGWGRLLLALTPTAVTLVHFRAQGAPLAAPLAAAGAAVLGLAVLIRRRRR